MAHSTREAVGGHVQRSGAVLIEQPTDVSIRASNSRPTDTSMSMADDLRLELLDLDARGPPELRCQRPDMHDHDPADPDAGENLEADPADRLDAGDLVTSYPRASTRAG